jgi:hypothetical protein
VTVVSGELRAFADGDASGDEGKVVAIMTGTTISVRDRPDLTD